MQRGNIKAVKLDRGFGFIEPADGSADLFFHVSSLDAGLEWDVQLISRRVEFETDRRADGKLRAKSVRAAR